MGRGEGAECVEITNLARAERSSEETSVRAKIERARDSVSEFFATKFGLSSRERVFLAGALLTAPVTAVGGVAVGLGVAAATAAPHLWQRARGERPDASSEWAADRARRAEKRAARDHNKRMKNDLIYRLNNDLAAQSATGPEGEEEARELLQRALGVYRQRISPDSESAAAAAALASSLEASENERAEKEAALEAERHPAAAEASAPAAAEASAPAAAEASAPAPAPAASAPAALRALEGMSDKELTELRRGAVQEASEELLRLRELDGDHSAEMRAVIEPLVREQAVTFHPRWKQNNEEALRAFGVLGSDEEFGDLTGGVDSSEIFYEVAHQRASSWCLSRATKGDKMSYSYLSEFIGYGYRDTFGEALRDRFIDEIEGREAPQLLKGLVSQDVRERAFAEHGEEWAEFMREPYFWCNFLAQTQKTAPGKKAKRDLSDKQRAGIVLRSLQTIAKARQKREQAAAAAA